MRKPLILGSSSPYRKELLSRLNIPFECHSPSINETALDNESPEALVKRLTVEKAFAVDRDRKKFSQPHGLIISSDQVAVIDKQILGKPLNHQNAVKQLSRFCGKKVSFITGLCLLNQEDQSYQYVLNEYHVYFRELTHQEIDDYVKIEQPFNCAGSFKCEGLGISLFEKMEGDDPNSLIGLPLISLCKLLRDQGINPTRLAT